MPPSPSATRPPSPSVAPSPLHPYYAAGSINFAPFALYAMSLACADICLLFVAVSYAYCFRWPRSRANRASFDHDIERPRQQVEVTALPVEVLVYRGDAKEFNSDECVICLGSFEEGEECWVIKTCNHVYHESCIKEWLSRNQQCPLCRGSVQARQATRVTPAPTRS